MGGVAWAATHVLLMQVARDGAGAANVPQGRPSAVVHQRRATGRRADVR